MSLDDATRHALRVLLNDWQRGARDLEDLYDVLEDLVVKGVTPQPAPTPDQLVTPVPSV